MQKNYYCTTNLTRIPMSFNTMSLVIDVYGIKTDAQFLQTLHDNVRKQRTMNKLVSDSATSETSKAGTCRKMLSFYWKMAAGQPRSLLSHGGW